MSGRSGRRVTNMWIGLAKAVARAAVSGGTLALCLSLVVPGAQAEIQTDSAPIDPSRCQVAPRSLPLWNGTPPAVAEISRPDPATGEPADDAKIRGITGTIEESTACANAGQRLRVFALVTDDFLARQFVGDGAADVTESGASLERPESPPRPDEYLAVVAIEDPTVFPDGSVGALVVTESSAGAFSDYVVFVEGETRWLIDASFPVEGTPATPDA